VSYTVLARRYRSRDFDEVVGQSAIADTLKRAVEHDRTAHAYLFCGTRGVGKTTMARIFARAINVTGDLQDGDAIAEAIMRGDDLDVIEIDGASNRGVQEARDLIAAAGLSPARCQCRIYIIDEVHMLTTESFNTLLKTMEEPPDHVKFILCTTEPHKVLQTIQSRCQRFDFKPISGRLIAEHLRSILDAEGVSAEDAAIARVAELGNGSMRDALSVMDRLLAAEDGGITLDFVEATLGLPARALVDAIIDAIASGDTAGVLTSADALLAAGTSIEQAMAALVESFRAMLIVSACGATSEVLEASDARRSVAVEQASRFDAASIVHAIAVCDAVARQGRLGASARAVMDAGLVRLALGSALVDPSAIAAMPPSEANAPRGDGPSTPPAAATSSTGTKAKGTARRPAKAQPSKSQPSKSQPSKSQASKSQASRPQASRPQASKSQASKSQASKAQASKAAAASEPPAARASLEDIWTRLVSEATTQAAKAAFEGIHPVRFDGDLVVVRSEEGPVPAVLVERLASRMSDAAGRSVRVESDAPAKAPAPTVPVEDVDDPRVELAKDLFDATVIDVRKGQGGSKDV
jgi:DNA polymerase-3 subunit gamma/tau